MGCTMCMTTLTELLCNHCNRQIGCLDSSTAAITAILALFRTADVVYFPFIPQFEGSLSNVDMSIVRHSLFYLSPEHRHIAATWFLIPCAWDFPYRYGKWLKRAGPQATASIHTSRVLGASWLVQS